MALDEKGNYVFYFKDNPADESYIEPEDCRLLADHVKSGFISVQVFSDISGVPEEDVGNIVIMFMEPNAREVMH